MIVVSSFAIVHSISTAHQVAHHSRHTASHQLEIIEKQGHVHARGCGVAKTKTNVSP